MFLRKKTNLPIHYCYLRQSLRYWLKRKHMILHSHFPLCCLEAFVQKIFSVLHLFAVLCWISKDILM